MHNSILVDFDEASPRSVTYHQFRKKVLPDSHHTPQVLYVYSTFSARSIVILKSSWERAAKDLEKLGQSSVFVEAGQWSYWSIPR